MLYEKVKNDAKGEKDRIAKGKKDRILGANENCLLLS
jgi:hypothetical protein